MSPTKSMATMMSRPSSAVVFSAARTRALSMALILEHPPGMADERLLDRLPARLELGRRDEQRGVAVHAKRGARALEAAVLVPEQRSGSGPAGTVAVELLGAELRAQRDELGQVRDHADLAVRCD